MVLEIEEEAKTLEAACPSVEESNPAKIDDILNEKLESVFHKQTSAVMLHELAKIACEHSAIDLAYAAPRIPPHARVVLYENLLNIEDKMKFMINTDNNTRIAILREISDGEIKKLIEHTPADDAVEILEDISERRYRRVMDILETKKAQRVKEIKKNRRNTAGRLMTNEFFSFLMDVTIGEAARYIRDNPGIDLTRRIFVINPEGEILGYIPARNLIVNPQDLPLKQVMRPVLHKVVADTSREEVVEIVERYKISALPVVDDHNRLIGVITYEDVLDALEDIVDETIGSVAGTAEKISQHEPVYKRFLSRSPWLLVTLCAGLVNVGVMSTFGNYERGLLTFVFFFVPLITGMSGNIGIQCSTILVRSMALGLLTPGNRREVILKELLMGIMTGLAFGILCGVLTYLLDLTGLAQNVMSPLTIGLIVSTGLFGACFTGTLLGVFSPFFFARIGVDPAVASGPIVTAFNDFLSMSIYFLIAIGLSNFLL